MLTIKLKGVEKRFHDITILQNVNVEFKNGKIYGIIGPNGSGKSVLLNIICGLMKASEGTVTYNDKVVTKDINVIPDCGIIINKPAFFKDVDAFHNLKLLADINGKINDAQIKETINKVGLIDDKKKVGKYSVGMLQRLGIAQAIMENPNILILDEFTNGLDEDGITMIHSILKEEREKDKLIIVTSHNKYDIEALCDEVFKLNGGTLQREK